MKKEQSSKTRPRFRFMAMSKLIGLIVFTLVFMTIAFSMWEMHITSNYEALPQLIISVFGFASIYAGFYLTMAKVEHVEEERTRREKELASLKRKEASQEEIDSKKQELENLSQGIADLIKESTQNLL